MAFARCEKCDTTWNWGSLLALGKRLADIPCPKCDGRLKGINAYYVPGAAEIDESYKRRLLKSGRGTWAYDIGRGRAAALTATECAARGLKPGPGNN